MELSERAKEIRDKAIEAGISEKRLDSDVRATYLPEEGEFIGYEISNAGEPTAHIRVTCSDGSSISVGTIKALAFAGSKEEAKFRKVTTESSPLFGKFSLTGQTAVNPHIGGKQHEVVDRLIGKKFKAEPVELVTLSYNEQGYATEKIARDNLVIKKFYKVTLL